MEKPEVSISNQNDNAFEHCRQKILTLLKEK